MLSLLPSRVDRGANSHGTPPPKNLKNYKSRKNTSIFRENFLFAPPPLFEKIRRLKSSLSSYERLLRKSLLGSGFIHVIYDGRN